MCENKLNENWQKAEVISKLLSGIILTAIGIVITLGANKISRSLESGRLVESLIQELSNPDSSSSLEQDIALVTLDHTLSRSKSNINLVLDICQTVALSHKYNLSNSTKALEIIGKHDSSLYRMIINERFPDRLRKKPSGSSSHKEFTQEDQQAVGKIMNNLIYIQYKNKQSTELVEGIRNQLKNEEYNVPPIDLEEKHKFKNAVIYFYKADSLLARNIINSLTNYSTRNDISMDSIQFRDFSNRGFNAAKGQVEIWLDIK